MERATLGRWRQFHDVISQQDGRLVRHRLQHRAQQYLGVGVRWRGINLGGGPDLAQPPLVQHRHPVCQGPHHRQVVRDKQVGGALVALELVQQFKHRGLHGHIQRRGHLVTQHNVRLGRKGAGDGNPLFFTARHLAGQPVQVVGTEAHTLEQLDAAFMQSLARETEIQLQRLRQNLRHGVTRVQAVIRVLEDQLNATQVVGRPLIDIRRQGIAATQAYMPSDRRVQAGHGLQDAGLAAARLTHQADGLARADPQVDVCDGVRHIRAAPQQLLEQIGPGVADRQAIQGQHRRRHRPLNGSR